jgi:hypothetical protein
MAWSWIVTREEVETALSAGNEKERGGGGEGREVGGRQLSGRFV